MDERELIYSQVAENIFSNFADCYVTQKYEPVPEQIPCVFIQLVSKVRTRRYADLDNTDRQWRLTFEAQVFAETVDKAYELMNFVEEQFTQLSFMEEMCMPVSNADPKLFRLVARFSAQRGDFT